MSYVVLGGSGFIGTEIVKRLLQEGKTVVIGDIKEPVGQLVKYWKFCDVTDPFQTEHIVSGSRYVIHLAANPSPRLAEQNPRWDLRINVEGTLNVIEACKMHGARMLFASTAAIKHSPHSCYSISKYTAELYIKNAVQKGLDAVIVRYNNVYGPTQTSGFVIPDLIDKLRQNPDEVKLRGTGKEQRDFVYIDDIVTATLLILEKGEKGKVYEIGTGKPVTIEELARMIGRLMNGKEPRIVTEQVGMTQPLAQELTDIFQLGWVPTVSLEQGLQLVIRHRTCNTYSGATYVGPVGQRRENSG